MALEPIGDIGDVPLEVPEFVELEWDTAELDNSQTRERVVNENIGVRVREELWTGYDPKDLPEGLVAYWPFDETTGDAIDVVGGHNGNIEGSPSRGEAGILSSNCYKFTFDDDEAVSVPDDPELNFGTGDLTTAAWVYNERDDYSTEHMLMTKYQLDGTTGPTYMLGTDNHYWRFRVRGDNEADAQTSINEYREWTFLVGVRDGDTARLYVNGSEVATDSASVGSTDNSYNLNIGRAWTSESFDGRISDPMLYGKALTPEEIQTLYDIADGGRLLSNKQRS